MQGTSIRNIKRNKSQLIMGQRLNRYGSNHETGQKSDVNNFKSEKDLLKDKFFSPREYFRHKQHLLVLFRAVNYENDASIAEGNAIFSMEQIIEN